MKQAAAQGHMKMSPAGIKLIKKWESCKLKSYQDLAGKWTVGWGHTGPDVIPHSTVLQITADFLLSKDIEETEVGVNRLVTVRLNQNQFDAVCCLAFNIGLDEDEDTKVEGLGDSTLLKLINQSRWKDASMEWLKWNHSGGKVVKGLTARRQAESILFMNKRGVKPDGSVVE